jgi:hypothetical protein
MDDLEQIVMAAKKHATTEAPTQRGTFVVSA